MNFKSRVGSVLLLCAALLLPGCAGAPAVPAEPQIPPAAQPFRPVPEPTQPSVEQEPMTKIAQATVAATGDLLMHVPVIRTGLDPATGEYDFASMFLYFKPYVDAADYAAANLETTLCGLDNGYPYRGFPRFNCPDGIVDSLKAAGFDGILTANNHSFDTGETGFFRTLSVIDDRGLDRLGTNADPSEKKYLVKDLNGIRVGMTCFTYETEDNDPAIKSLNVLPMTKKTSELINTFRYEGLEDFYTELSGQLSAMEEEGAEATVVFLHWGHEYWQEANPYQKEMAQRLCDLGVDVIIGGHPHVVQPVELLTSGTDPEHRTVCLYSMGNAVSNQRTDQIPAEEGHTEDGVLFQVTFAKYSDATVVLEEVDLLPTWVNLTIGAESGKRAYEIIPLDREVEDWQTAFSLTDSELDQAQRSLARTTAIVGEGLEDVRFWLQTRPEPDNE